MSEHKILIATENFRLIGIYHTNGEMYRVVLEKKGTDALGVDKYDKISDCWAKDNEPMEALVEIAKQNCMAIDVGKLEKEMGEWKEAHSNLVYQNNVFREKLDELQKLNTKLIEENKKCIGVFNNEEYRKIKEESERRGKKIEKLVNENFNLQNKLKKLKECGHRYTIRDSHDGFVKCVSCSKIIRHTNRVHP